MYLTFTGHMSLYENGTSPFPTALALHLHNGEKLHKSEVAYSCGCIQILSRTLYRAPD
jgi:hypothetical protein